MSEIGTFDGLQLAVNGVTEPVEFPVFEVRFDWTSPPLSMNDRHHHHKKAALTRDIRETTALLCRRIPPLGRCEVSMTWYVTDRRRRDDENPVATLKPICDELVTLGVVEDDTNQFMVKRMPQIVVIPKTQDSAHIVITIRAIPRNET